MSGPYGDENSVIRWAGWRRVWDPDDLKEVMEHHRALYDDLKSNHTTSPEEVPGLLEGVEELLEYGYSLTDIGAMFGLSRERVRQWVNKYDLARPYYNGAQFRIWSDEEECFVPVGIEEMEEQARLAYHEHQKRNQAHELALRWDVAITAVRGLAEQLGRLPTVHEVAQATWMAHGRDVHDRNNSTPNLLGWLDPECASSTKATRYRDVSARLWKLSGFEHPGRGVPSHRENRTLLAREGEAVS